MPLPCHQRAADAPSRRSPLAVCGKAGQAPDDRKAVRPSGPVLLDGGGACEASDSAEDQRRR